MSKSKQITVDQLAAAAATAVHRAVKNQQNGPQGIAVETPFIGFLPPND